MLTALGVLLGIPLAFGGILWWQQERMIFVRDARVAEAPPGWARETVETPDGLRLAFLVAPGRAGAPVVLYFHGNGGNAQDRTGALSVLARRGFSVVVAGYRGYGGNPGDPGEEGFAEDAQAHLAWAQARFGAAPLVLWGESLGTGVVTRLAEGRRDVAAIVLESPFTSVADMAAAIYPWLPTGMLLRHRFESLTRLPGIAAPILVVATEQDPITPVAHARRMLAAARDAEGVFLPGGAHPAVLYDASGEGLRRVLAFLEARVGR